MVFKSDDTRYTFPLPNSFGLCEDVKAIKFLENVNATTCSRYTLYDTCDTNLNGATYEAPELKMGSGTVTATASTSWTVDASKVVTAQSPAAFQTVSKSGSPTCTCTNVLKELHITAFVSGGDTITSLISDVVYTTIEGACTSAVRFDQTFSFTFKESDQSRLQSGSPGYQKGKPILAGALDTTNTNFMTVSEQGFELYGANDAGTCLIETGTFTSATNYYTNPILSFVDGAMYG